MPQTTLYPRFPKWPYWKPPYSQPPEPPAGGQEGGDQAPAGPPTVVDEPYAGATGEVSVGTVLNCTMGNWNNMQEEPHSYAYKWLRNGTAIPGATVAPYTTKVADAGAALRCELKATNSVGTATALSNEVTVAAISGRQGF